MAAIKSFGTAGKKTAVISTINGDANVPFYKELGNQGVKATDIPVMAFSVGEEELKGLDTAPLVGHLAAWSYFQSIDTPENKSFVTNWQKYRNDPKAVTNDPMESSYDLFNLWAQAVAKAGSTGVDAVSKAIVGEKVKSPTGYDVVMNPNHHLTKPVFIGEIQAGGQFSIVYESKPITPHPWSPFLPQNVGKQ